MTDYLTKLTSLLIAPHGITDIIYSYETDTMYTMIGIYIVCPIISKYLNYKIRINMDFYIKHYKIISKKLWSI